MKSFTVIGAVVTYEDQPKYVGEYLEIIQRDTSREAVEEARWRVKETGRQEYLMVFYVFEGTKMNLRHSN